MLLFNVVVSYCWYCYLLRLVVLLFVDISLILWLCLTVKFMLCLCLALCLLNALALYNVFKLSIVMFDVCVFFFLLCLWLAVIWYKSVLCSVAGLYTCLFVCLRFSVLLLCVRSPFLFMHGPCYVHRL